MVKQTSEMVLHKCDTGKLIMKGRAVLILLNIGCFKLLKLINFRPVSSEMIVFLTVKDCKNATSEKLLIG